MRKPVEAFIDDQHSAHAVIVMNPNAEFFQFHLVLHLPYLFRRKAHFLQLFRIGARHFP